MATDSAARGDHRQIGHRPARWQVFGTGERNILHVLTHASRVVEPLIPSQIMAITPRVCYLDMAYLLSHEIEVSVLTRTQALERRSARRGAAVALVGVGVGE